MKLFILFLIILSLVGCSKSIEDNAKEVAEKFIVSMHRVDEKKLTEYKKLEELILPGVGIMGDNIPKGTVTGPNEEYTEILESFDKDIKKLTTDRAYEKILKNRYNFLSADVCDRHNYTSNITDIIFSEDLYKDNKDIEKVRYSYEANISFESTEGKDELNDIIKGYIELTEEDNILKVSLYTIDQYPKFPENQ